MHVMLAVHRADTAWVCSELVTHLDSPCPILGQACDVCMLEEFSLVRISVFSQHL